MQNSKILELLRTANINNHQLEIALGLSNGCINKWTTGNQRPNIDTLMKIADYFGVSVDYLLGRETSAATTTATGKTSNKAAANVTTAPILNVWAQLDEIQQAKALAYCKTLIAKDNRPKGVVFES